MEASRCRRGVCLGGPARGCASVHARWRARAAGGRRMYDRLTMMGFSRERPPAAAGAIGPVPPQQARTAYERPHEIVLPSQPAAEGSATNPETINRRSAPTDG